MNQDHHTDAFVRQALAAQPRPAMPDDVFARLDKAVRAEAERRERGESDLSRDAERIAAAKRTATGSFGQNPRPSENEIAAKESLQEVRKVLRRH